MTQKDISLRSTAYVMVSFFPVPYMRQQAARYNKVIHAADLIRLEDSLTRISRVTQVRLIHHGAITADMKTATPHLAQERRQIVERQIKDAILKWVKNTLDDRPTDDEPLIKGDF